MRKINSNLFWAFIYNSVMIQWLQWACRSQACCDNDDNKLVDCGHQFRNAKIGEIQIRKDGMSHPK